MTDPVRRRRVEELCDAALSRVPAERAAFLAAACGDEGLRHEVEALLAHAHIAGRFLEEPIGAVAARVLDAEPGALVGQQIGAYRITSLLGAGGMGEVYQATDTRLARTVAVKVLPEPVAADPRLKQRFEAEARTLAALSHPHICPVFDVGSQNGIDFLVMEYLEGETLERRLKKGALPLDQALQVGIQIADALAAAHRAGIVHRDLKPGNVMLTKSGAKLLDFGLAKLKAPAVSALSAVPTQDSPITVPGTILGTMQYMAPEQIEGHEADGRTDIFAFGAVVYEMATGKKAFEGNSQASLIGAILKDDPRPISSLQPMSPPALDRVITKCLAKDPDGRWQSARDLRDELQWTVEARSQAGPPTSHTSAPQRAGCRRAMPWVAGVLLGGAVTGLGVWSLTSVAPTSAPLTSRFVITSPESAPLANQPGYDVIISPDGRRIVYFANDAKLGRILFVRNVDRLEAQAVPGTENAFDPFFSPDGAWIGFERGTALMKVAVAGGAPLEIVDAGAQITGTAWGVDDTLVFARFDGLYKVPATGGSVERLAPERPGEQYLAPRFLPGANAVLFHVRQAADFSRARLGVLLLETGEQRILIEGAYPYYASGHVVFGRGTTLMAAPFSIDRLEVTGSPVALTDIRASSDYAVSDTTMVYVSSADAVTGRTVTWVGRDGGEEALAMEPRNYGNPRVSPDGGRVAVSAAGDIWIHDVARGTTTRLTFDPGSEVEPLWAPDGARIVFSSNREGSFDLYQTRADGTGTVQRLTTGPQHEYPSAWRKGARELVFMDCRTPQIGLCDMSVVSVDGERQPKVLLRTEFNELFPTVSPDGRWLAYESDTSGRREIYVRPYPDVESGLWQVSTGGGTEPLWGSEGNELFYRTPTSLMVMPVSSGVPPTFGKPQALFNLARYTALLGRNYDISPKGDRFIFVAPTLRAGGMSDQIIVVQNWHEELKRLVPTR